MTHFERHADLTALLGRLFLASMFLLFGLGKITAFSGTASYMSSLGLPAPSLATVIAIIVEVGGGLLILIGYQTRLVALALAIYVLATAFIGHFQLGDMNQFQHFMKNMAIVGGLLGFAAFGAGAYSLDARNPEPLHRVRTS